MSANTVIKEGGNTYPFGPVDYLRVASGSDQYALWVPESERVLTTKSISKNGIYRASEDGAYGWSSVYVNVPKPESVTGKDGDGDEVVVKPDPETGVLEEEKVPSSIEVITPPTVPSNTYVDGQSIVPGDMVVKAYLASGEEYGVVPNGEISLNPNRAVYDESTDQIGHATASSELLPAGFSYSAIQSVRLTGVPYTGSVVIDRTITATSGYTQYACVGHVTNDDNAKQGNYSVSFICASSQNVSGARGYTHDNKTVYYTTYGKSGRGVYKYSLSPVPAASSFPNDTAAAAWTLIYGDVTEYPAGSPMTITVSWPRPGDGAVLETSFDIHVGPHGGTGED